MGGLGICDDAVSDAICGQGGQIQHTRDRSGGAGVYPRGAIPIDQIVSPNQQTAVLINSKPSVPQEESLFQHSSKNPTCDILSSSSSSCLLDYIAPLRFIIHFMSRVPYITVNDTYSLQTTIPRHSLVEEETQTSSIYCFSINQSITQPMNPSSRCNNPTPPPIKRRQNPSMFLL